jgi:hypothetical protein
MQCRSTESTGLLRRNEERASEDLVSGRCRRFIQSHPLVHVLTSQLWDQATRGQLLDERATGQWSLPQQFHVRFLQIGCLLAIALLHLGALEQWAIQVATSDKAT